MRNCAVLTGLLLFVLIARCGVAPALAASQPAGDPTTEILARTIHANRAATQARALGWVADGLGLLNLVLLVLVVIRQRGSGVPILGSREMQIATLRRRQRLIAGNVAKLNERLTAYLDAVNSEREGLEEALRAINDQAQRASTEIDQAATAAPRPGGTG